LVLDPYMGVGTTACAAIVNGRRAVGAEIVPEYVRVARRRIALASRGELKVRPRDRPVHRPPPGWALLRRGRAPAPRPAPPRRTPAQGLLIAMDVAREEA